MELPAYSRLLNAEVERKLREREDDTAARAEAERIAHETRLTPVVERLKKFIDTLPADEQGKPRPLEFYRRALRGRKGGCAQAGEIGSALRELGYVRKRNWSTAEAGFRSSWVRE